MSDGGPAFPVLDVDEHRQPYNTLPGMSLRDYFAIHCDQPGEAEIVTAAGGRMEGGRIYFNADDPGQLFSSWYQGLTQERRFELYAWVRYALADAMLKARKP